MFFFCSIFFRYLGARVEGERQKIKNIENVEKGRSKTKCLKKKKLLVNLCDGSGTFICSVRGKKQSIFYHENETTTKKVHPKKIISDQKRKQKKVFLIQQIKKKKQTFLFTNKIN